MQRPKVVLIAALLALCLAGFGWAGATDEGGEAAATTSGSSYTLKMMAHYWMPTELSTASVEQPMVITGLKVLADRFSEMYPDVQIEFIQNPIDRGSGREWLQTRILQNDLPNILADAHHYANEWNESIFLSVEEYAYQPNPFIEGNVEWKDSWRGAENHIAYQKQQNDAHTLYQIPTVANFSGNWHYANMAIMDELGLSTSNWPQLYNDWKVNADKIQGADYSVLGGAPWYMTGTTIASRAIKDFVVLRDSVPERFETGTGVAWILQSDEEVTRAIKKGIFSSRNPAYQAFWTNMKNFAGYHDPSTYPGVSSGEIMEFWRTGDLALLAGGSGDLLTMLNDADRSFEFGFVGRPQFDKRNYAEALPPEWSVSGTEDAFGNEGTSSQGYFGISKETAEDPQLLEYALLWLQFITAPEQNEFWVNERGRGLPVAVGTNFREEFKAAFGIKVVSGFHPVEGYPKPLYSSSPPHGFDNELELGVWGTAPTGYAWDYLKGNISWNEFAATWDRNLEAAADRNLAEHPEWDQSRW